MKILIKHKGFTIIELLVALAILTVIISFGVIINFSAPANSTFDTEESKIVSLLGRARSQAMANMFESVHGFCYNKGDYVIFYDDTCDKSNTDEIIPANINIAENSATILPIVIFDRLSGNTDGFTIHLEDGTRKADIIINNEGTINW